MLRSEYLIFGSPLIEDDEISEVVDSLKHSWIGTGPKVAKFENAFRTYKNAAHAVALNSCTAALHLSMLTAGVKSGDEVISTPLTFCATINAIIHTGATPVLADIDPVTMNIDPREIEKKITKRTKAIVPVHFAGRPCDMNAICAIAQQYNLTIIEDCAHAIEAEYHGKKVGTFGEMGCFSFYVTKNIVTGEGGMIITENKNHAARLKVLALHGMSSDAWQRFYDKEYKHYWVTEAGFKYNMMDIQAGIGIHQLKRIDRYWNRRREIWNMYNSAFKRKPLATPKEAAVDTRHAYHLYTILVDQEKTMISRDEFLLSMHNRNIGTGVHYLSIPEHPFYQQQFGWVPADFPNAMRVGRQTVSLPLSPKLTDSDVADVIEAVHYILKQ